MILSIIAGPGKNKALNILRETLKTQKPQKPEYNIQASVVSTTIKRRIAYIKLSLVC